MNGSPLSYYELGIVIFAVREELRRALVGYRNAGPSELTKRYYRGQVRDHVALMRKIGYEPARHGAQATFRRAARRLARARAEHLEVVGR